MRRRSFIKYTSLSAAGIGLLPSGMSCPSLIKVTPDTNSESYPSVVLSNGILDALIFIPDKDNGYYRSVRFDWSGFMAQVTYNGHTFFQDWTELESPMPGIHDPLNTASGTGIAEEFREPLGYETATTGQPFLKIGVGLLEKDFPVTREAGNISFTCFG